VQIVGHFLASLRAYRTGAAAAVERAGGEGIIFS